MGHIALRPSYWASVSGGKDSLYMLNVILNNLTKYPLTGVVHFELEIDFPFVKDVVDYMESRCKSVGIPFLRIKPRTSWYDLYKQYGFPTAKIRWCNGKYKMDAVAQLKAFLHLQGYDLITYIGYCANEVDRFANKVSDRERYPLVEENVDEADILQWAKTVSLFNDYYKYNKRCGCMYCPMQGRVSLAYLLKYYPENYNFLMKCAKDSEEELERRFGKPMSVWDSKPKYNTDYIDKRVRKKYIPLLDMFKQIE